MSTNDCFKALAPSDSLQHIFCHCQKFRTRLSQYNSQHTSTTKKSEFNLTYCRIHWLLFLNKRQTCHCIYYIFFPINIITLQVHVSELIAYSEIEIVTMTLLDLVCTVWHPNNIPNFYGMFICYYYTVCGGLKHTNALISAFSDEINRRIYINCVYFQVNAFHWLLITILLWNI